MDADGITLLSRQHFLSARGTLEAHCKMDIIIESSRIRPNIDENYKKGTFETIQPSKKCFIKEMHNMNIFKNQKSCYSFNLKNKKRWVTLLISESSQLLSHQHSSLNIYRIALFSERRSITRSERHFFYSADWCRWLQCYLRVEAGRGKRTSFCLCANFFPPYFPRKKMCFCSGGPASSPNCATGTGNDCYQGRNYISCQFTFPLSLQDSKETVICVLWPLKFGSLLPATISESRLWSHHSVTLRGEKKKAAPICSYASIYVSFFFLPLQPAFLFCFPNFNPPPLLQHVIITVRYRSHSPPHCALSSRAGAHTNA